MAKARARSLERLQVLIRTDRHALVSDEPGEAGDDLGPDPYELLLSALGACTTMTVQMYARRKSWPLDDVRVELSHARVHQADCEHCEEQQAYLDRIHLKLELAGDLSDEQLLRLREIAARCPVRKTLEGRIEVVEEE